MNKPILDVYQLGLIPYRHAWNLQKNIAEEISKGTRPSTLLLLEHPHTFTFGHTSDPDNLLWSKDQLEDKEATIEWIDRGGDVTYHGPGQLVGYPLIPLGNLNQTNHKTLPRADYIKYIRLLEKTIIITLSKFGILSGQISSKTGVWIQPDVTSRCIHCPPEKRLHPVKIASIGIKVDVNGISQHGFAINIAPDMSYWEGIIACGLKNTAQISLKELMIEPPSIEEFSNIVLASFVNIFGFTIRLMPGQPDPDLFY